LGETLSKQTSDNDGPIRRKPEENKKGHKTMSSFMEGQKIEGNHYSGE